MEEKELNLWENYEKDRTVDNRNNLLEYYLSTAEKIANDIYNGFGKRSGFVRDDFISWSYMGLIDIIDSFDKEQCEFYPYAYMRIKGIIQNELSNMDDIKRNIRKKLSMLTTIKQDFFKKYGSIPTEKELCEALSTTVDDLRELLRIEVGLAGKEIPEEVLLEIEDNSLPDVAETVIMAEEVTRLLDTLSERDYFIFKAIHVDNRSLTDIGKELGCGCSRISQKNEEIINKLRKAAKE